MQETQNIEFKESWRDEYLRIISAFANSQGGKLFLGVKDNGDILGVNNGKKLLEDIPNKSIQFLGLTINVNLVHRNNFNIVEVIVLPSDVPISYKGKYYIRSGSTVQELTGSNLRNFILKKDSISWDEIVVPDAKIYDLDSKKIKSFVFKAVNAKRLPNSAANDDVSLILQNLNLVKDNGEITRAAVLLFGKRPKKYLRAGMVKIGRFGNSDADLISHDVIEGNILEMPDKIMEVLRVKYLQSRVSFKGITRVEILEYPENALREAILNALVHRDFGEQTDITIKIYDKNIVIWNSGVLLEPLTVEMLKREHPSKRRNPLIADVFFKMGYVEAWGRGISLMQNELKSLNWPEPILEEFAQGLKIVFQKPDSKLHIHDTDNDTDYDTDNDTDHDTDNDNRLRRILNIIEENPNITTKELAKILILSVITIKRDLDKLKKMGKLERKGTAKGGYWLVVEV